MQEIINNTKDLGDIINPYFPKCFPLQLLPSLYFHTTKPVGFSASLQTHTWCGGTSVSPTGHTRRLSLYSQGCWDSHCTTPFLHIPNKHHQWYYVIISQGGCLCIQHEGQKVTHKQKPCAHFLTVKVIHLIKQLKQKWVLLLSLWLIFLKKDKWSNKAGWDGWDLDFSDLHIVFLPPHNNLS